MIGRNFEVDNYSSELFSVTGAMMTKPILKDPINPVTKLCNAIDEAGVYYRTGVIRGTKGSEAWRD